MSEQPAARHFRFGPRSRRGLFAGLGPLQVAVMAASLLVALVVVRSTHSAFSIALAVLVVALAAGLSTWPVAGKTTVEWLPVAADFASSAVTGRRRVRAAPGPVQSRHDAPDGLWVVASAAEGSLGMIVDPRRRTVSAALALAGVPFALLGEAERQHVTDGWSSVLAAVAMEPGPLARLSWIERTVPDQALELVEAARAAFANAGSIGSRPSSTDLARRSYLALVEGERAHAMRHESLLVVTVRGEAHSAAASLREVVESVRLRCSGAGIEVSGALSATGLSAFVRRTTTSGGLLDPDARPSPLAYEEEWSSIRTDGTHHALYWVAEWPRSDVASDFLLPLLLQPGVRRTTAVMLSPTPPERAVRAAERDRTEAESDRDLRRRHGFALTARVQRQQDGVVRRERELAAGHGAFGFTGIVGVTATSRELLERDCARVEQAAAASRLSLRRLYGSQRRAFSCLLPGGRVP